MLEEAVVAEDGQVVSLVRAVGLGGLLVPVVVGLKGVDNMEDTDHTEHTDDKEDMRERKNNPLSGSDSRSCHGRVG